MDGIVIYKTDAKKIEILRLLVNQKLVIKKAKTLKGEAKFIYTGAPVPGLNKTII